jgi:hypothetical protein
MNRTHPPDQKPEQDIDRVLTSLGQAAAPAGLEARIAHRLLQTREIPASTYSFWSVWNAKLAATAAILALISFTAISLHHRPDTASRTPTAPNSITAQTGTKKPLSLKVTTTPQLIPTTVHRSAPHTITPLCDCDPTALAETLAPSHPAPIQPLTPQERLLVLATRRGSPIEVAELDQLREPVLRAAATAREHANLRQYMQGLLAPLAISQTLDSTTSSSPANNNTPKPSPSNDPTN